MSAIAADIGGTHARFARIAQDGAPADIRQCRAADFPGLEAALEDYGAKPGVLLLACAANRGADGKMRFHNSNPWTIDTAELERAGWTVAVNMGDFEASARGALALPADGLAELRRGAAPPGPGSPRIVTGPGTGLGLAFLIPLGGGRWHVRKTHGGHMLAACLTAEQAGIADLIKKQRGASLFVPEDAVSGRGFPGLHRAVCALHGYGQGPFPDSAEDILRDAAAPAARHALRLFHEFFGLFVHNAAVTGDAYGGLYLDGGMTRRLHEAGLFDFATFEKFMVLPVAEPVRRDLASAPVFLITDPFAALHGLAALYSEKRDEKEKNHAP